jgi:radical SAM superfamily enzyme YgiQ (UPF0313 family)
VAETVFLVNPPNPPGYVSNKDSMGGFGQLYPEAASPFPPIDLPYLAAWLLEHGIAVTVFEAGAMLWSPERLCHEISAASNAAPATVVLRTSLPTIDWDLDVAMLIKSRCSGARIVLYGPAVGPLLERIQQSQVDYIVVGEPDQTVLELVQGMDLASIAGLEWRSSDGEWVTNPPRAYRRDLDSLPFPRWELFPYERYTIPKSATAGTMRCLPMQTSRGCPFGCNYCPYPVGQGSLWRYRSPENVVDELEHLVRDLGVEYVIFRDPLFSANKKRVVAICEEIVRRRLSVKWRCETRVDCLDESTIAAMAKAGCVGVNFGVESVDPQIQRNVDRKPITSDEFVVAVRLFRKYGIKTFAFFVVGLPGDTVETILASIRFALQLRPSWVQFTVATPFIGTRLFDWAVEQHLLERDRYRIISAHEGAIGNENLTPAQVHLLHRFAQILQRNVLNRRGILKNELRSDWLYRASRRMADLSFGAAGWAMYWVGSWMLRKTLRPANGHLKKVSGARQRVPRQAVRVSPDRGR